MTGRPNIPIFMADQLAGPFFPDGPAEWLHAPNLKASAARAAFMSGQLPSRNGVYDNAAEASEAPMVALRKGPWKLVLCKLDPDMLFNMADDPQELHNLAGDPAHIETLTALKTEALARWDLDRFDAEARASQPRRWVVYEALRNGAYFPWDFQPLQKASERYCATTWI